MAQARAFADKATAAGRNGALVKENVEKYEKAVASGAEPAAAPSQAPKPPLRLRAVGSAQSQRFVRGGKGAEGL